MATSVPHITHLHWARQTRVLIGELRLAVWPRSDRRHGVPAPWLEEITSALAALATPAAEDTRPLAA